MGLFLDDIESGFDALWEHERHQQAKERLVEFVAEHFVEVLVMIEALVTLEVQEIHAIYEKVLAEVGHYEKQSPDVNKFIEDRSDSCKSKDTEAQDPRPKGIKRLKYELEGNQWYDHF